jgi:hypothetical protein
VVTTPTVTVSSWIVHDRDETMRRRSFFTLCMLVFAAPPLALASTTPAARHNGIVVRDGWILDAAD